MAEAVPEKNVQIRVSASKQKLYLLRGDRVWKKYKISTSKYGIGNKEGSNRTPLGRHRIARKFGKDAPIGTIFKDRKNTGKTAKIHTRKPATREDLITSRVLWLEGLENGKNRGEGIDSFYRYIYIHGTPDEDLIGKPASHGCVRMKNKDVIELFELVHAGTPVEIVL